MYFILFLVAELLNYVPLYHHVIPHRLDRLRQPRLPLLRIREGASRRRSSFSVEVSNLIEGTVAELAQLRQEAEGLSTGSSVSSSTDSSSSEDVGEEVAVEVRDEEEDAEIEEGEEVN